ncbi:MAG: PKD domain-containing protein [Bacteroidota bacterium]
MKGTVRFLVYSGLLLFTLFLLTTCRDVESVDPNRHPVAVAGPDVTATSGSSVTLDASKSSDPDGDSLSYEWLILTKPQASQATILHFDSVKGIFTPDVSGLYLIRLVVTDNIAVNADTIDINVIKANHPPVANAGPDGKVNVGASYNLTGSGTDPDGDTLTYSWTLPQKTCGEQFNDQVTNKSRNIFCRR